MPRSLEWIGWLVATGLFALYVANFANYSNTYGALGGVIVLMLWFYISALILVAAAALVAATLKELHPVTVAVRRRAAAEKAQPTEKAQPAEAAGGLIGRPANPVSAAAVAAAASAPAVEHKARSIGARRAEPASGPGDWAVAGLAVAVGVALGTVVARVVGTDRR